MVAECKREGSIEEMMQRVEWEQEEIFEYHEPAPVTAKVAVAEEVPKSRVSSAVEKLEGLEWKNKKNQQHLSGCSIVRNSASAGSKYKPHTMEINGEGGGATTTR